MVATTRDDGAMSWSSSLLSSLPCRELRTRRPHDRRRHRRRRRRLEFEGRKKEHAKFGCCCWWLMLRAIGVESQYPVYVNPERLFLCIYVQACEERVCVYIPTLDVYVSMCVPRDMFIWCAGHFADRGAVDCVSAA